MRAPPRSWVEDYVRQPDPINPELVRAAMAKRGLAQRKARMSDARTARNGAGRQDVTGARTILADHAEAARRAACSLERARIHLQRRGYTVVRADVLGGPADRWRVGCRSGWLSDAQMVAIAETVGFKPGAAR